ncbi:hypothetical protein D3C81_1297120 [compost metagenome]
MLIIVHNGNCHFLFQTTLNFKTFRSLDIFQVDTSESWFQCFYNFNELVNIFGVHFNVKYIDVSKNFEQ